VTPALSGDGSVLAVGAYLEDSAARGVGGDQTDNAAMDSGAVFVYW
jgi:trimeric autotransporter adhesin